MLQKPSHQKQNVVAEQLGLGIGISEATKPFDFYLEAFTSMLPCCLFYLALCGPGAKGLEQLSGRLEKMEEGETP